jgi:hypothetical protein
MIKSLYELGTSLDTIALSSKLSIEEIKDILNIK